MIGAIHKGGLHHGRASYTALRRVWPAAGAIEAEC
eukprot:XP_001710173.1 Hypothetical protein GL50803_38354 [Giardia lamblia ATCC 50803]